MGYKQASHTSTYSIYSEMRIINFQAMNEYLTCIFTYNWYNASVPELLNCSVSAITNAVSYHIEPRYNGTRLYIVLKILEWCFHMVELLYCFCILQDLYIRHVCYMTIKTAYCYRLPLTC